MNATHNAREFLPSEYLQAHWPATASQLASIRDETRRFLAPLRLSDEARCDLLLAVDTAVGNSIEHAYALSTSLDTVALTFWTETRAVCIEVVDHGQWRTPPDGGPGQGLGISMMERLVDSVAIHYDRRGTRVLLRHALPGRAPALSMVGDRLTRLAPGGHPPAA